MMDKKDTLIVAGVALVAVVAIAMLSFYPLIAYVLFAVAGVFGIGFLCFKYKWARITTVVLVFVALLGGSIYCGYNLDQYYSAKGGILGTFSDLLHPNQVKVTEKSISFSALELKGEGDTYSIKIREDYQLVLEENKTFGVFVNNSPCTFVETAPDYVRADYVYEFTDSEMRPILTDTLHFRFALGQNYTEFNVTTNGGSEAVKYWNSYFARNNFVVTIKQIDKSFNTNPEIVDGQVKYALANYYVQDQPWLTQVYHIGDKIDFPFPEQISKTFAGWSTDRESVVESYYTITTNTNFYAIESESAIYTITYKFKDKVLYTQRVNEGEPIPQPQDPTITGYKFKYWKTEDGQQVNFENLFAQSDTTFIAECSAQINNINIEIISSETNKKVSAVEGWSYGLSYTDDKDHDHLYAKAYTGDSTVTACINLYHWYEFETDSQGKIRYEIVSFDAVNGTNIIDSTAPTEKDYMKDKKISFYKQYGFIDFSNVNTAMSIKVYVKPIKFNVEFVAYTGNIVDPNPTTRVVLATAKNLTFGVQNDLHDFLNTDEINYLLNFRPYGMDSRTLRGFSIYTNNVSTDSFRYFTNLLGMVWLDEGIYSLPNGYEWSQNFNPETNTFTLFAIYTINN